MKQFTFIIFHIVINMTNKYVLENHTCLMSVQKKIMYD